MVNPNPGVNVEMNAELSKEEAEKLKGTMGGILVHTPPADPSLVTWTPERVQLLKRQCVPQGCTDDEFAVFLLQCKRTELDPVIGEAFCVPRRTNTGTKDHPNWVLRHVFQPAVAGMAARADRFPDYGGIKGAAIYEKDEISFDQETQTVSHKSNPITRGRPIGAWAQVIRHGRTTPISFVKYEDYAQQTAQWGSKGATMIFKCAKAAAYREAYPNRYGGLHIDEEMSEEREVNDAPPPPTSRTDEVKEKLAGIVEQQRKASPTPPAPGGQTVNAPAKGKAQPRVPGTYNGTPIKEMDGIALAEATKKGQAWIDANLNSPDVIGVRTLLGEMLDERDRRMKLVDEETLPTSAFPEDAPF